MLSLKVEFISVRNDIVKSVGFYREQKNMSSW